MFFITVKRVFITIKINMAYSIKTPRKLGWSPKAFYSSSNIGEDDIDDGQIRKGRCFASCSKK